MVELSVPVAGLSDVPLMARTIGDAFDRTCALHADRDAVVSRHQGVRLTYRELGEQVGRAARDCWRSASRRATGSGSGSRTASSGSSRSSRPPRSARSSSTSTPPTGPHELRVRTASVRRLDAHHGAPRFRSADYLAMIRPGAGRRPARNLPRCVRARRRDPRSAAGSWNDVLARAEAGRAGDAATRGRRAWISTIRSTSSTPRARPASRRAPRSRTTTFSTTASSSASGCGSRPTTASACRCPFITASGCVLGNLAALTHGGGGGRAGGIVRPGSDAASGRGRALHVDLRRADDVHRRCSDIRVFDEIRPRVAADRHHGGLAVPDRGDATGDRPDAHARGHDLLRHDGDLARLVPVRTSTIRSRRASRRSGRSTRTSECKIVSPETGEIVPRGTPGELCTRGYSVMLGYWNNAEATSAAIDAARWMHTGDLAVMREDGYVNIVGPHQGHDHPWRRERLSARDRGVPLHASEDRGRAGDRSPGRSTAKRSARGSGSGAAKRRPRKRFATSAAVRSPTFKIPRYIRFSEEFPVTVTGKVQKYRMREISVAELGLEDAAAVVTA